MINKTKEREMTENELLIEGLQIAGELKPAVCKFTSGTVNVVFTAYFKMQAACRVQFFKSPKQITEKKYLNGLTIKSHLLLPGILRYIAGEFGWEFESYKMQTETDDVSTYDIPAYGYSLWHPKLVAKRIHEDRCDMLPFTDQLSAEIHAFHAIMKRLESEA